MQFYARHCLHINPCWSKVKLNSTALSILPVRVPSSSRHIGVQCYVLDFRRVRKFAKSDYKIPHVYPSIHPSASKNSSHSVWISMKFCIGVFYEKLSRKIVSLKSDKSNGYIACRTIHILKHVLLNSF